MSRAGERRDEFCALLARLSTEDLRRFVDTARAATSADANVPANASRTAGGGA